MAIAILHQARAGLLDSNFAGAKSFAFSLNCVFLVEAFLKAGLPILRSYKITKYGARDIGVSSEFELPTCCSMYILKARIVEPEKDPLLGNRSVTTCGVVV
jgi:hypothetical protein